MTLAGLWFALMVYLHSADIATLYQLRPFFGCAWLGLAVPGLVWLLNAFFEPPVRSRGYTGDVLVYLRPDDKPNGNAFPDRTHL